MPAKRRYPEAWHQAMRLAWLRASSQCRYRGEGEYLTWNQYQSLWDWPLWQRKNRSKDGVSVARLDPERPWLADNVFLVENIELCRQRIARNQGRTYSIKPEGIIRKVSND